MDDRRTPAKSRPASGAFSEKARSDFERARQAYRNVRKQMIEAFRDLLAERLQNDRRYAVIAHWNAGCGSTKYHPHNKEDAVTKRLYSKRFGGAGVPTYDLGDWRWIEIEIKSKGRNEGARSLLVSFQSPDFDKGSKNHHSLQDRIALIDGDADGFDGNGNFEDTGLTLPLSEDDADTLVRYIEERLERMGAGHGA